VLKQSAFKMAAMIRKREISSVDLVTAHLTRIGEINPALNAAVAMLADSALRDAAKADKQLAAGEPTGPLHGVPVSVKDSIDLAGGFCTAGTLGRKSCPAAEQDAELVKRLRAAGAIPIAKTNLPELLFAYESDNFIFGRTNNPYDLARTAGGSSGGESALIAACGSPLGLGSDAAGSVRLPAHFCGIASIKPTTGRLSQVGHVPPPDGIIDELWSIGPMARYVEDLCLALDLLSSKEHLSQPPRNLADCRVAIYTDNGFARCTNETKHAVQRCAEFLSRHCLTVEEQRPPGIERAYDLEMGLLGADGGEGIEAYLLTNGTPEPHPLLVAWLDRLRPLRAASQEEYRQRFAEWDRYRGAMADFFTKYDVVLCPVYTQPALLHGESVKPGNFEGFSYTMAWNVAGTPAAVVRCGTTDGLPINVQVVTGHGKDYLALQVCGLIEQEFGGWQAPTLQ
jgi:amidase